MSHKTNQADALEKPQFECISFSCSIQSNISQRINGTLKCFPNDFEIDFNHSTIYICISSIPNSINRKELIEYLKSDLKNISHVQFLLNENIYLYMALLKFKDLDSAIVFYKENNKTFLNKLLQMASNIYMVESIEILENVTKNNLAIHKTASTELACSICFDPILESNSTIFTSVCNHSFHLNCISKWNYGKCPNCRQNQTPEDIPENLCQECHSNSGLWLCMICGHIGCNRYLGHHALNHYIHTNHTYAQEIGTDRVWNYASDNFVHRLIQDTVDNKIVEVECGSENLDLKLDAIGLEYMHLVVKELNNQRKYYEDIIENLKMKHENEIRDIYKKKEQESSKKDRIESNSEKSSNKRYKALEKKFNRLSSTYENEKIMFKMTQQKNQELVGKMNDRITKAENNKDMQDEIISQLEKRLEEAYFYIEAQQVIKKADNDDLENDSIIKIKYKKK